MWLILHMFFCVSQVRPSEAVIFSSTDSKKKDSCTQKKPKQIPCCFFLQLFHILYRTQLSPDYNYLELNSFDLVKKSINPSGNHTQSLQKLLKFSKSVKSEQQYDSKDLHSSFETKIPILIHLKKHSNWKSWRK